jgi:hypothetical protein
LAKLAEQPTNKEAKSAAGARLKVKNRVKKSRNEKGQLSGHHLDINRNASDIDSEFTYQINVL